MTSIARTAVEWMCNVAPASLPADVRASTRLRVLDVLGLILAASATPFGAAVCKGALALSGQGRSRILPSGERTSPGCAALANGALSQALQYDDTHNETIIHVSSPNVAAALALADAHDLAGARLVDAVALGIELTCRFGLVAPGQFHGHGFHPSGIFGTLGATCTAARLLDVSPDVAVNALGLAGSFASGLLECWTDGTDAQWLHPGWSAQGGIAAVEMARAGVTGPETVLEGRFGLFAAHLQDKDVRLDLVRATADLGEVWESRNTSFKPYPCAHVIHAFLDALLALRAEHGLDGDDIASIECPIAAYMIGVVCEPVAEKVVPPNAVRARVSLPWCMAEAAYRGRLGVDAFDDAALADPRIRDLAGRVSFPVDPEAPGSERYKGWVVVTTRDGRRFERIKDHNHGSVADPMSPGEIRAKFEENAARAVPAVRAAAVAEAVDRLDDPDSGLTVSGLLDLCVADD